MRETAGGAASVCRRCEVVHQDPCSRCGCEHTVSCAVCSGWHLPYRLGAEQRCCARTFGEKDPHRCGRPTSRTFCGGCYAQTEEALDALPELYVALYLGLQGGTGPAGDVRPTGYESKVPLDVAASDQMQDIIEVLCSWETYLREHLGFAQVPIRDAQRPTTQMQTWQATYDLAVWRSYGTDDPQQVARHVETAARARMRMERVRRRDYAALGGQRGPTLTASTRFLRTRLPALLQLDPHAGSEVVQLHRGAQRIVGLAHQDNFQHLSDVPCPYCGQRTLVREYGEDVVDCQSGAPCPQISWDDYQRLSYIWAQDGKGQAS